ncbi:hypothetical protein [Peribacillus simplex]|uniref:hypothetical protein n=1 Tax=Peribacillus simplex TaxID=1478 RepID=UPI0016261FEB|nr:hypothetical protein [Peribacillus simplex]
MNSQDKNIELLALNVENENFFLNIIKYHGKLLNGDHGNTNTMSMKRPPTVYCGRP